MHGVFGTWIHNKWQPFDHMVKLRRHVWATPNNAIANISTSVMIPPPDAELETVLKIAQAPQSPDFGHLLYYTIVAASPNGENNTIYNQSNQCNNFCWPKKPRPGEPERPRSKYGRPGRPKEMLTMGAKSSRSRVLSWQLPNTTRGTGVCHMISSFTYATRWVPSKPWRKHTDYHNDLCHSSPIITGQKLAK